MDQAYFISLSTFKALKGFKEKGKILDMALHK